MVKAFEHISQPIILLVYKKQTDVKTVQIMEAYWGQYDLTSTLCSHLTEEKKYKRPYIEMLHF